MIVCRSDNETPSTSKKGGGQSKKKAGRHNLRQLNLQKEEGGTNLGRGDYLAAADRKRTGMGKGRRREEPINNGSSKILQKGEGT